jgi:DNA-binding winged helix-turn-helix (wHTH) protein
MPRSPFRLGAWLVRPDSNELIGASTTVRLEPKAMDVLLALARRPGEVVSKDDLLRQVWTGTFIADGGVFRVLSELRRALGDNGRVQRYIETVPKRGYRLVAPVAAVLHPDTPVHELSRAPHDARPVRTRALRLPHRWRFGLAGGLLAAVAALVLAALSVVNQPGPAPVAPPVRRAFAAGQVWEDRADCAAFTRARAAYEHAIRDEPLFAAAHVHLIDSYIASAVIGCVPSREARDRVDSLLSGGVAGPDAQFTRRRGSALLWLSFDREGARRLFDSIPAVADVNRAALLLISGAADDAVSEARRALDDAPAELGEHFTLGVVLLLAGRPREGADQLAATLDLYPGFPPAQNLAPLAWLLAGDPARAATAAAAAARAVEPPLDRFSSVPGLVLARVGRTAEAASFLARWRQLADRAPWVAPTAHAVAALAAGDRTAARRWMQRARDERDPWLVLQRVDPLLADLVAAAGN